MPFSFIASMTRLKPSVRSWVSSTVSLNAASAMSSSRIPLLVQIIGVLGDVLGEPERMLAHQVLGAFGVARLERLDDVHVIADRALDAVVLADLAAADHAHMREQVRRQPDQRLVAAELDQSLVEGDVDLGIFVEFGVQLVVFEGRE